MFWSKVECDGCNAKIAKRGAIFHRGSYFCNASCRDTWEAANPPRIATGDPATLARDLVQTIDAALDAFRLANADATLEQHVAHALPLLGRASAEHDATVRSEHAQRFTEATHECIPIARALGYREEVAVLERYGFGADIRDVIAALERVRARAARHPS